MIIVIIQDYLKLILFVRPLVFSVLIILVSCNCFPINLHADESGDRCVWAAEMPDFQTLAYRIGKGRK